MVLERDGKLGHSSVRRGEYRYFLRTPEDQTRRVMIQRPNEQAYEYVAYWVDSAQRKFWRWLEEE